MLQVLAGFYQLWDHVGATRASSYYHLLLATAFNRRTMGVKTHPRFDNSPGYWYAWNSDSTYIQDTQERLSVEQIALINEHEDEAVEEAAQQAQSRRKKRSTGASVRGK